MTKLLLACVLFSVACGGKSDGDSPAAVGSSAPRSGTIDPPPAQRPHHDGSSWGGGGSGSGSFRDPAARHERAVALHTKLDTNNDGKLSIDELKAAAAGGGRMMRRFSDPSTIDTNNDGDISVDELDAAMAKRGGPRRHGGGGSGEDDGDASGSGSAAN